MIFKNSILFNCNGHGLSTLLLIFFGAISTGCNQQVQTAEPTIKLSVEDEALRNKFRGISGGERRLDAITDMHGVTLFDEMGRIVEARAIVRSSSRSLSSFGGGNFSMPKTLRAIWFEEAGLIALPDRGYEGKKIGDVTVPVASRIPVDVLDEVRKNGGTLRFKIRMSPDGPLIGWDITSRPLDPKKPEPHDPKKIPVYYPIAYDMTGGDFKERRRIHLKKTATGWEKIASYDELGWYIDKKTGQKIETDF